MIILNYEINYFKIQKLLSIFICSLICLMRFSRAFVLKLNLSPKRWTTSSGSSFSKILISSLCSPSSSMLSTQIGSSTVGRYVGALFELAPFDLKDPWKPAGFYPPNPEGY